eukprot:1611459-Pleurochrysis_carterae.AAC.1
MLTSASTHGRDRTFFVWSSRSTCVRTKNVYTQPERHYHLLSAWRTAVTVELVLPPDAQSYAVRSLVRSQSVGYSQ